MYLEETNFVIFILFSFFFLVGRDIRNEIAELNIIVTMNKLLLWNI